jgi:hypothetical protein
MTTSSSTRISIQQPPVSVWSVDRIARLIVGIANIFFLLATYFISPYFLIGLGFVNLNLVFTSMTDNCPFKNLLKKLGAKEREELISSKGDLIEDKKSRRFPVSLQQSENV